MTKKLLIISLSIALLATGMLTMQTIFAGQEYDLTLEKTEIHAWGYSIIKENQIIIKQKYIPCLQGNYPFISKKDAKKTGLLVIKKLKNQESPACTFEELKSLGVIP